jgi:uncharacterized membrane protein
VSNRVMKTLAWILIGIVSLFIAAGVTLPALAKFRDLGMPGDAISFYTFGIVLAMAGTSAIIFGAGRMLTR